MSEVKEMASTAIDLNTVFKLMAVRRTPQMLAVSAAQGVGMHVGNVINNKWIEPALWGESGILTEYFEKKDKEILKK